MPEQTAPTADQVGHAVPAPAKTNAEAGISGATAQSAPQYVSMDDFKRLQEGVGKLFATLRPIEEAIKSGAVPTKSEAPKASGDELGMAKRLEVLEARERAAIARERQAALVTAANDASVPADRTRVLLLDIQDRLGDRISVNPSGTAVVRDETGGEIPLQKYLSEYMATEQGSMFRPARSAAQMPAAGGRATAGSSHPFSSMSHKQIMEASKRPGGGDLLLSYMREHNDEFQAKKQA